MNSLRQHARNIEASTTQYLLGWLIGIPVPVLVIIYLLRGE